MIDFSLYQILSYHVFIIGKSYKIGFNKQKFLTMESLENLTQLIRDTSQPIATRRAAVVDIADIGTEAAYNCLIDALSDPAPGVRREVANALQHANYTKATPALEDALRKEDSDLTRWSLIDALGNIGTLAALPTLETLLESELSPLTRREIQKSIDLINRRHPDDYTVDTDQETNRTDVVSETETDSDQSAILRSDEIEVTDNSDDINRHQTTSDSDTAHEGLPEPSDSIEEDSAAINDVIPVAALDDKEEITQETGSESISEKVESTSSDSEEYIDEDSTEPTIERTGRITTTPVLPVLVPNTSLVVYNQEDSSLKPSFYALVLRPSMYLSKRWLSRSRLYLVLLSLLIGATVALVYSQVQRLPRPPYAPNLELTYLNNPEDYLATGSLYLQQGNYRKAIEELSFVVGVEDIDLKLYKCLGDAYFQEKQYAHAIESYQYYLAAREVQPYQLFVAEASFSLGSIGEDEQKSADYKTFNALGISYRRLGQFDKAHDAYVRAIGIAPKESQAYSNLAELYSDGYQQKPKLSLGLAYASVIQNPYVASSHDIIGWTLGKTGRFDKATDSLEQAYRLQSDYIPTLYHITELAEKRLHPEKTLDYVETDFSKKVRRKNITRAEILDVLAFLYEKASQKHTRFRPSLYQKRGLKWR